LGCGILLVRIFPAPLKISPAGRNDNVVEAITFSDLQKNLHPHSHAPHGNAVGMRCIYCLVESAGQFVLNWMQRIQDEFPCGAWEPETITKKRVRRDSGDTIPNSKDNSGHVPGIPPDF
jgi:hypothetical protein